MKSLKEIFLKYKSAGLFESVGQTLDKTDKGTLVKKSNEVSNFILRFTGSIFVPEEFASDWLKDNADSIDEENGLIYLKNDVDCIGNEAFYHCSSLTSVTIPNSVTSIGNCAFYHCSGLTSVTIPNSVKIIEEDAFGRCPNLKSVVIPNSVTDIWSGAFSGCTSLTSVTIPNSVMSIDEWVFSDCNNLKSVSIPYHTKIESNSFPEGCKIIRRKPINESVGQTINSTDTESLKRNSINVVDILKKEIIDYTIEKGQEGKWIFISKYPDGPIGEGIDKIKDYPIWYDYPTLMVIKDCDFIGFRVMKDKANDFYVGALNPNQSREYYKGYEISFKNGSDDKIRLEDVLAVKDETNNEKIKIILQRLLGKLKKNPDLIYQEL